MTEQQWAKEHAKECATWEQGGAQEYLNAAYEYENAVADGWSGVGIADAVTKAGFPIHKATVNRRLAALKVARATRLRANSKAFLEAFAEAYANVNAIGRGTPVPAEERRRVYLEGVVAEFERQFEGSVDLTEDELGSIRVLRDKCDAVLKSRLRRVG